MSESPDNCVTEPEVRVLHVIQSLGCGGAERLVFEAAAHLNRRATATAIAFFDPANVQGEDPFTPLYPSECPLHWPRDLYRMAQHLSNIKTLFQPSVVHVHAHNLLLLVAFIFRSQRVCYTVHSAVPAYWKSGRIVDALYRRLIRRLLQGSRVTLVTLSSYSNKQAHRRLGIEGPLTQIIPNGLDILGLRARVQAVRKLDAKNDGWFVLWIGRFDENKDPTFAVRAFAALRRVCPDAKLVMCGTGALKANCVSLAEQLGCHDYISFPGYVRDIAPFLGTASVLWFTSSSEGHPLVWIEALATGLPIVTTPIPELQMLIESQAGIHQSEKVDVRFVERTMAVVRARTCESECDQSDDIPYEWTVEHCMSRYLKIYCG